MSTSSGSRVRREGTIATSSNPYALRAILPLPISISIASPPGCSDAHPLPGGRQTSSMRGRYHAARGRRRRFSVLLDDVPRAVDPQVGHPGVQAVALDEPRVILEVSQVLQLREHV